GTPLDSFVRLVPLPLEVAEPDLEITFTAGPLGDSFSGPYNAVIPVWLTGIGKPILVAANAKELCRNNVATVLSSLPVSQDGLLPLDFNNDFRMDLLLAGREGLRFYQQEKDGSFTDVTAKTRLPADVLKGDYFGAWARDMDADGDIDIVL